MWFGWVLRTQLLSSQYTITDSHLVSSASVWGSWNRTRYMTLLWHLSSKSYKTSLTVFFSSIQFSCSVMSLFVAAWTLSIPVHHQLPELAQTHVHRVGDAIQPPHPLLSPPPSAFNLSQHQGLFQWVSSLNQVASVLEFQLQHQSFQWIFKTAFL